MPAYNFQARFVPMILNLTKFHTVRRRRKRLTKAGDILSLYTGMRTKKCKLLLKVPCVKVLPIIVVRGTNPILDGIELTDDETTRFVIDDGFADGWQFYDFFDRYSYEVRRNELEVIYWR